MERWAIGIARELGRRIRGPAIRAIIAAGLVVAAAPASFAALISENSAYGADTITLDTNTGLEWLDVTLTQNRSINDISAKLGAGQEFAGFRYAFQSELHKFFLDAGVSAEPIFASEAAGDVAAVRSLIPLVGQTLAQVISGITVFGTKGLTADHGLAGPTDAEIALLLIQEQAVPGGICPCATAQAVFLAQSSGLDLTDQTIGSFLVRTEEPSSSIAEPATLALVTMGLAGMGMVRRRRVA